MIEDRGQCPPYDQTMFWRYDQAMARTSLLTYDRGTLILHPPPKGKAWVEFATWDDRIEKFRIPAQDYRHLILALKQAGTEINDKARAYQDLSLDFSAYKTPYSHQQEALDAWKQAGRNGVVVLPTAAGKTYLAHLAIQATQRSTLILVPTLDLMHQWYAGLLASFPNVDVGLLGGGSRDRSAILVSTYDSAAIHAETIGNLYGLLVFDECHHLPTDFNRVIASFSLAPFRLGLSATPERSDGKHADLNELIGAEVYRRTAAELTGTALAAHDIVQIKVTLSQTERDRYDELMAVRNAFLQESKLFLGSPQGWQRFVQASARSKAGRKAMLAHREARSIAFGTEGKIRVLGDILTNHDGDRTLIFTDDNATVYRISQDLLIPAITHQTPVKERHEILEKFKSGAYKNLIASRVLNEGVDVPEASVAVVLSGTGSTREHVQRLGRILRRGSDPNKRAVLYEVVAQDTNEEGVSKRRYGETVQPTQLTAVPDKKTSKSSGKTPGKTQYPNARPRIPKAAESLGDWD
jgi:superfamily II DNA or RNA helicase